MVIYTSIILLFVIGLGGIFLLDSLVKKLLALSILQIAVLIFYLSLAKIEYSLPPILVADKEAIYTNPLPQVLMLTAIVVGFATLSVGLALLLKIHQQYKTLNYFAILKMIKEEKDVR